MFSVSMCPVNLLKIFLPPFAYAFILPNSSEYK